MGGEPRWGKMGKKKDICQPNNTAIIFNIIITAKKWSSHNGLLQLCYCLITEGYCHWWGQGRV